MKGNLQFQSLKNEADIEKKIPVEDPDVLSKEELEKESSLFYHELYTVVPLELELAAGIFPEDQGFSKRYVFLWDTYRELSRFSSDDWKKIKIKIPKEVRFTQLTKLGGGIVALSEISNKWTIEEVKSSPLYDE